MPMLLKEKEKDGTLERKGKVKEMKQSGKVRILAGQACLATSPAKGAAACSMSGCLFH